ncbi:MAG: VCBS repeat-containing protein, partial [Bdellovibrionia bacterium]
MKSLRDYLEASSVVLCLISAGCSSDISIHHGTPGAGEASPRISTLNLTPQPPSNRFGFNDDFGIGSPGYMEKRSYRYAREAGMGWVRYWVYMYNVQNENGSFNWETVDNAVVSAQAAGLNLYITLAWPSAYMTPGRPRAYRPWNCMRKDGSDLYDSTLDYPNCTTNSGFDVGRFQDFVNKAVARYGDRVKYWGFSNEMSDPVFWRSGNVYTQVYIPGYDAAKAEAQRRGFNISIVGPENNIAQELRNDLAAERSYGRRMFDVISFHHYSGSIYEFLASTNTYRNFNGLREVWLTEAGAVSLSNNAVSEAAQASTLLAKYQEYTGLLNQSQLNRFFLYRLRANAPNDFGILREDQTPKKAYLDLKTLLCPAGSCAVPSTMYALPDFTGDRFADFADFHRPSAGFWIHQNYRNGSFSPFGVNWGYGPGMAGDDWTVIAGDFTGDGHADFADVNLISGGFWVHENMRNGTFNRSALVSASLNPSRDLLVADFNGDRYADIIERDRTNGKIWVRLNPRVAG